MKTEKLNELFNLWKSRDKDYVNNFVKDGIINETEYEILEGKKILFIAKEVNDENIGEWDYREYWNEFYKPFEKRLAQWTYGILEDFPPYTDLDYATTRMYLTKMAFMNVKKSAGGTISKNNEILAYIKLNLDLIQNEIFIIDPDIILLGISTEQNRKALFPDVNWVKSVEGLLMTKSKNAKIIDFYHPSAHIGYEEYYNKLRNIINADDFKNL